MRSFCARCFCKDVIYCEYWDILLTKYQYFRRSPTVNTANPRVCWGCSSIIAVFLAVYSVYWQYTQHPVYCYNLCLILDTHPAAVTVGEQVHRDRAQFVGCVLRRVGFPRAEAFPHPSAGALRVRLYAAGRCLELVQGHPRRHGVAGASCLGRQCLPILPLREGDSV